jgi:hypothetical protein
MSAISMNGSAELNIQNAYVVTQMKSETGSSLFLRLTMFYGNGDS